MSNTTVSKEDLRGTVTTGGDQERLPCGCRGKCDPYAHDTAWDWDGRPDGPGFDDLSPKEQEEYLESHGEERCEQCGNRCPSGDGICGACAAENERVEDSVNEQL